MTREEAKAVGLEGAIRQENNRLMAELKLAEKKRREANRCSECGQDTGGSRCYDCEDRARIA